MQDTDKIFCSILFDVLAEKGVRDVVCCPGSRNAPLLIAAANRDNFHKHFAVDERAGAFMALGLSLVSKKPVALICTSGTALLNFAPAIAEAYYQGIPLIAISADRPDQWIDQDDSQTIRQNFALTNFVKKSYSIPAYGDENEELQWYVNRITNDAVNNSCSHKPGPVHINIALNEPLGNKLNKGISQQRIIRFLEADAIGDKEIIRNLAKTISNSKVLLIAGFMQPDARLQKVIAEFSRHPNVVVMAETISNLHLSGQTHSIDSVLACLDKKQEKYLPDLIIYIGGALISRKLKEYIRSIRSFCTNWSVGYSNDIADPFMNLGLKIETEVSRFFKNVNGALRKLIIDKEKAYYKSDWEDLRHHASSHHQEYILKSPWSELKAFDFILKHLPSSCNLFLSNGTPVRYAQIIDYTLPHASYCNRGVSGIDGSVSTAIGGAAAYKGMTILITGDLSFTYDIGGLALSDIPDTFKIIVIDNQGGGIFRFINSTSNLSEREDYFCMSPKLPLTEIVAGYGWNYFEASDMESLKKNLKSFLSCENKSILRIKCDGIESAEILKKYFIYERMERN